MSGRTFIGADVGATTIAGGLVSEDGRVLWVASADTHIRGRGTAVETLLQIIGELVAWARHENLVLAGIGIGLPGLVDVQKGMMVGSENLVREFANVPLADGLGKSTGLAVFVDNDANALALGELTFGVGRGASSMALLAIGTGVGGAIVLGGELVRGKSGAAGEFGHVPIDFRGAPCVCGGHGCLDLYVGGRSLADAACEALKAGAESRLLASASNDLETITAVHVFQAAAAGDALASALVDRACDALGAGIGVIVNSLDPELVVVTGGVAGSLVLLENRIVEHASRYALAPALARTRIRIVPADKRRTVLGGAALALYELQRHRRE